MGCSGKWAVQFTVDDFSQFVAITRCTQHVIYVGAGIFNIRGNSVLAFLARLLVIEVDLAYLDRRWGVLQEIVAKSYGTKCRQYQNP